VSDPFVLVECLYTDTSHHICHVSATWRELESERTLVELPLRAPTTTNAGQKILQYL